MPLYVCEVKQPILSVTRLVEQGFQLTLDDNPRQNRNGLFFLQAEITTLPKRNKATDTQYRTRTDWYDSTDHNAYTTQGELVRVHRQHRKTRFTPSRTQCPVPAEQLEDYRKTTIRSRGGATNAFEGKCQTTEDPNKAQPKSPETLQQQFTIKTQPRSEPQRITPQVIYNPRTRLREKTPPTLQESAAPHTTKGAAGQGIPHPSEVHPGGNYWYREGPQRFTYQSRHTTGQTSSDSCLGDRPRHNQLEEKDNTQD